MQGTDETTTEPDADASPHDRRDRVLVAGLVIGSVVALFRGLSAMWGRDWTPVSDWASIELRVRDVGTPLTPLFGAWSRYGWNHVGPMMFFVLALPYRLAGRSWEGLAAGALAVNVVCLVGAVLLARRSGRAEGWAVLAVATLVVASLPGAALVDWWNPSMCVLPCLLVGVAAFRAGLGDRVGLAVSLVAWSWIAQAHVGYGVVLLPVVTVGAVGYWRRRTGDVRPAGRTPRALFTIVVIAAWVPPLLDTVAGSGGNLRRLISYVVGGDGPPKVGVVAAWEVLAQAGSFSFVRRPYVDSFNNLVSVGSDLGALPGVLFVVVLAARVVGRHDPRARVALDLVIVHWIAGLVAVASIGGPFFVWFVTWLVPLVWWSWVVAVLVLVRRLAAVGADRRRVVPWLGAATLAAVVAQTERADLPTFLETPSAAVPALGRAILDAGLGSSVIDFVGDEQGFAPVVQAGLVGFLDRAGAEVTGRPDQSNQFGDRSAPPGAPTLVVVVPDDPAPTGATALAAYDPRSAAENSEIDELTADLAAFLRSVDRSGEIPLLSTVFAYRVAAGVDESLRGPRRADLERLSELRALGPEVLVYVVAPG